MVWYAAEVPLFSTERPVCPNFWKAAPQPSILCGQLFWAELAASPKTMPLPGLAGIQWLVDEWAWMSDLHIAVWDNFDAPYEFQSSWQGWLSPSLYFYRNLTSSAFPMCNDLEFKC